MGWMTFRPLWGGGLNRFDPVSGQFIHYMPDEDDPQTLSNDVIRLILEDHEGKLWLGTQHGLSHFDKVSGQVERYLHDADDSYSLPHDRIRALYEDRQHRIWVGTSGGLSLLDREEGTFTNWKKEVKNPQALRGNDVRSILQDHQGRIWVGTDAGLHQFDPEKGVVVRHIGSFDEPNGEAYQLYEYPHASKDNNLPIVFVNKRVEKGESNETLYRVLEDQQGTIWFSSNRGIGRLNPESGKLKRYTRGDGLQEDEFNISSIIRRSITCCNADKSIDLMINCKYDLSEEGYISSWIPSMQCSLKKALFHRVLRPASGRPASSHTESHSRPIVST